VREAAGVLGLDGFLDRKPKALSGGQRQRVAMGRAIVRDPAVFLFDEPLSNLDAKMRVEMRKEILRLHQRLKTTMIYVTHDQVEAMTLGDRICVMKDGIIQQVGAPDDVFDHPSNLFVAGFIGSPPMNLFNGTLRENNGGLIFDGGSISAPLPQGETGRMREHVGRKVYLGLRPRSFETPDRAPAGIKETVFQAQVELDEMLGEDLLVHMRSGSHTFTVSIDPHRRPAAEGEFAVCPLLARAHVFDATSGERLT
jgi:multiple sugar transport system ATP-binding protein